MSLRVALIGGSLLAHAGIVLALGGIREPRANAATSIEVFETKAPEPPPPAKVEPPPPEPVVQHDPPPHAKAAKAPAEPAPESAPPPPNNALAALPDFGLELGSAGGPGGLAVPPPAAAASPRPPASTAKTLGKAPTPQRAADACDEPPAKPKLLDLPQPAYTEAARAANVEGKVRVEITVDETGKVLSVRVLTSLGHGLDEAAMGAARGATFEPAVRCGRPSRSTFTVSIRFSAS